MEYQTGMGPKTRRTLTRIHRLRLCAGDGNLMVVGGRPAAGATITDHRLDAFIKLVMERALDCLRQVHTWALPSTSAPTGDVLQTLAISRRGA